MLSLILILVNDSFIFITCVSNDQCSAHARAWKMRLKLRQKVAKGQFY